MLKVCRKGDYLAATPLTPDEDRAVRGGFGRFATLEGRTAGAEVIQRHQHIEVDAGWHAIASMGNPRDRRSWSR